MKVLIPQPHGPPQLRIFNLQLRKLLGSKTLGARLLGRERYFLLERYFVKFPTEDAFDADGFLTCGLLWTPGVAIYYCNGKEVLRWENERISDLQEYIMYDMVSGGWTTTKDVPVNSRLNDARLPDDLIIDYVRVFALEDK